MLQRSKVQEMVVRMHEKNVVMLNILRDIAENEMEYNVSVQKADDAFRSKLADCTLRRAQILGEIKFLLQQDRGSEALEHKAFQQFPHNCPIWGGTPKTNTSLLL